MSPESIVIEFPRPTLEQIDQAEQEIAQAVAKVRPLIEFFDELGIDWIDFAVTYSRAQNTEGVGA